MVHNFQNLNRIYEDFTVCFMKKIWDNKNCYIYDENKCELNQLMDEI